MQLFTFSEVKDAAHAAGTRATGAEPGAAPTQCPPEHLPQLSARPQGWGWTLRWAVNPSHVAGITPTSHQHKGWGNQADFV